MKEIAHPHKPKAHRGFSSVSKSSAPNSGRRIYRAIPPIILLVMALALLYYVNQSIRSQSISTGDQNKSFIPFMNARPTTATNQALTHPGPFYLPMVSNFIMDIQMRPYSSTSFWNTRIGSNPSYDAHTTEMIATLGLDNGGRITSDPNQYSFPVYYADANTPRWNIPCSQYRCTVIMQNDVFTVDKLSNVPIPEQANPSPGSDGQMVIIDKITLTEYDLWRAERTTGGWTVANGTVYNILWSGTPARYGSRGAGVPYLAGLIRPWEIISGRIDHVLAFGYPEPASERCVYPASKTDGDSSLPYAIPEGAHLQLDPSLTEADFDRMGLTRTGKIIARALQEYGMVLVDSSGKAKIYVEDLQSNPYQQVSWSDPELNLTSTSIANIPYSNFRVLHLPDGYWHPEGVNPNHGRCFAHQNIDSPPE
jgi:hypothetical protein